jgi:hypothetical protein
MNRMMSVGTSEPRFDCQKDGLVCDCIPIPIFTQSVCKGLPHSMTGCSYTFRPNSFVSQIEHHYVRLRITEGTNLGAATRRRQRSSEPGARQLRVGALAANMSAPVCSVRAQCLPTPRVPRPWPNERIRPVETRVVFEPEAYPRVPTRVRTPPIEEAAHRTSTCQSNQTSE